MNSLPDRDAAIVAAYATGADNFGVIAKHLGIHLDTADRVVRKAMQRFEN